jgi:hypothetical protein
MGDGSQRLRALELANDVRVARAHLKRRVGAGQVSAGEVLVGVPWEAESMSVVDLLRSQRGWGRRRSQVFLASFRISETKTIASLTDRQRLAMAASLSLAMPARFNQRRPAPDGTRPRAWHAEPRRREPATGD